MWLLESMGDANDPKAAVEGIEVTAHFEAGRVGGSAGCNNYSASYELEGDNLKIGQPVATRKFCGASGVMEQEAAFLSALASASSYREEDDRLTIVYENAQSLNFHRQTLKNQP